MSICVVWSTTSRLKVNIVFPSFLLKSLWTSNLQRNSHMPCQNGWWHNFPLPCRKTMFTYRQSNSINPPTNLSLSNCAWTFTNVKQRNHCFPFPKLVKGMICTVGIRDPALFMKPLLYEPVYETNSLKKLCSAEMMKWYFEKGQPAERRTSKMSQTWSAIIIVSMWECFTWGKIILHPRNC